MHDLRLGSILRRTLLLTLAAPVVACGGATRADGSGDSGGEATSADAGVVAVADVVDAGGPNQVTADAGAVDTDVDAAVDAIDAGDFDASLADAGNGCVVTKQGVAGGANCMPTVLTCDHALGAAGSTLPLADCQALCPPGQGGVCRVEQSTNMVDCWFGCGGRRPVGFVHEEVDALASVGGFFENLAALEGAAVDAFEILHDELSQHGAPVELRKRAKDAARDEIRHARIATALAAREGRSVTPREHARPASRALAEIALENATEGCVRETFGALIAMHQAERAQDPTIRYAMRRIAQDETRHAELSWQIDAWLRPLLGDAERTRIEEARRQAIRDLRREASLSPSEAVVTRAGLPTAEAATRLLTALEHALWTA